MPKSLAAGLALAIMMSSGAFAADFSEPYIAPALSPVSTFNWSGLYLGLEGGYGWNGSSNLDANLLSWKYDIEHSGWLGGGHVGWQYQFGHIVVGAEGDVEGTSLDGEVTDRDLFGNRFAKIGQARVTQDYDLLASARLRLGYAVKNMLVYGTGGYAYGHVNFDASARAVGGPWAVLPLGDQGLNGWTLGAGFEALVAPKISVGVEYRYTQFQDTKVDFTGIGLPSGKLNNDFHAVRGRLSYHF